MTAMTAVGMSSAGKRLTVTRTSVIQNDVEDESREGAGYVRRAQLNLLLQATYARAAPPLRVRVLH